MVRGDPADGASTIPEGIETPRPALLSFRGSSEVDIMLASLAERRRFNLNPGDEPVQPSRLGRFPMADLRQAEPVVPHPERGLELRDVLQAERSGHPFILVRDSAGSLLIISLDRTAASLTVGREPVCDVAITWDVGVSRVHAEIMPLSGTFAITDEGLSRNGTFLNGERVSGRRRLTDRDVLRVGATLVVFRDPMRAGPSATTALGSQSAPAPVTPAQTRVLVALCRPMISDTHAPPASNKEIADVLVLSVAAIKSHIRALFDTLGVEDLPQNRKRARLAQLALQLGLVSERDLEPRR